MTTDTRVDEIAVSDAGPGPAAETCDLCGAVIQLDPGESRFEAVVAHFEAVHVDRE
jgi:hypothetical protein